MALNSEFLSNRARECTLEAERSSLPMVQERFSRAAAVWRTMSEQANRFEALQAISKGVRKDLATKS